MQYNPDLTSLVNVILDVDLTPTVSLSGYCLIEPDALVEVVYLSSLSETGGVCCLYSMQYASVLKTLVNVILDVDLTPTVFLSGCYLLETDIYIYIYICIYIYIYIYMYIYIYIYVYSRTAYMYCFTVI